MSVMGFQKKVCMWGGWVGEWVGGWFWVGGGWVE